jgi:hypothetical protein
MGFKGQRFSPCWMILHCKQAKSFVNVIQHGDGDRAENEIIDSSFLSMVIRYFFLLEQKHFQFI